MKDIVCGKSVFFSISSIQIQYKCYPTNCANQMNEWHVLPITQFRSNLRWTDSPNNSYSECVRNSTQAKNNLWIKWFVVIHMFIEMFDMNASPWFIQHSNQCRPIQTKTFHTINSIFSTWKQTVSSSSTNPCRQMRKHKQEEGEIYEDIFTMERKWLELQIVWCVVWQSLDSHARPSGHVDIF